MPDYLSLLTPGVRSLFARKGYTAEVVDRGAKIGIKISKDGVVTERQFAWPSSNSDLVPQLLTWLEAL